MQKDIVPNKIRRARLPIGRVAADTSFKPAIIRQHIRRHSKSAFSGASNEEFVILARLETGFFGEKTGVYKQLRTNHYRACANETMPEQRFEAVSVRRIFSAVSQSQEISVFIDFHASRVRERELGMSFHESRLYCQFFRGPNIVSIQKRYVLSFCLPQSLVSCHPRMSAVRLPPQNSHPRVVADCALDFGEAAVGRSVVHDDKFPVCIGLG